MDSESKIEELVGRQDPEGDQDSADVKRTRSIDSELPQDPLIDMSDFVVLSEASMSPDSEVDTAAKIKRTGDNSTTSHAAELLVDNLIAESAKPLAHGRVASCDSLDAVELGNNTGPVEVANDELDTHPSNDANHHQNTNSDQFEEGFRHLKIPDYVLIMKDRDKFFRERKSLLERPELRHSDCSLSVEELKAMSNKLENLTARYKFFYATYYKGQDPECTLNNLLTGGQLNNNPGKSDEDSYNRNLTFLPESPSHPNCCHSFSELRAMSYKMKNRVVRKYFLHITYAEGADPVQKLDELLSYEYTWQSHPDPIVSWEAMKIMEGKLRTRDERQAFVKVASRGFCDPEEFINFTLSQPVAKRKKFTKKRPSNKDEKVVQNLNEPSGVLGTDSSYVNAAPGGTDSSNKDTQKESRSSSSKARSRRNKKFKAFNEEQLEMYKAKRARGFDHHEALIEVLDNWEKSCKEKSIASTSDSTTPGTSSRQPTENSESLGNSSCPSSGANIGVPSYKEALSCYVQYSDFLSGLKRHPNCKRSLDNIVHMAEIFHESELVTRKRFILHTYQYGEDPNSWEWTNRVKQVGEVESLTSSKASLLPTPKSNTRYRSSRSKGTDRQPSPGSSDAIGFHTEKLGHLLTASAFSPSVPPPSSLKRKNSGDVPVLPKTSKPRHITATVEPVRALPKPTSSPDSLHLCIVPKSYPKERLTDKQMDAIENSLLEAILDIDDENMKPVFDGSFRNHGRYEIICSNEISKMWVHKYASCMSQPWPKASLKIVPAGPPKLKAKVILPPSEKDDSERILKFIARQNTGLNVAEWEILDRSDCENTCLSLLVDEESAAVLKDKASIYYKMGSAEMVVYRDPQVPESSKQAKPYGTVPNLSVEAHVEPPSIRRTLGLNSSSKYTYQPSGGHFEQDGSYQYSPYPLCYTPRKQCKFSSSISKYFPSFQ